jgi:hypothetical protein
MPEKQPNQVLKLLEKNRQRQPWKNRMKMTMKKQRQKVPERRRDF